MRKVLFIVIILFLSLPLYSQINTSFSFGSLGIENAPQSVFTGPVVIDGSNECMTLQNGLNLLVKESAKGVFRLGCRIKEIDGGIFFNVFPNPSSDYVIVKSEQNNVFGNSFEIDLQDIRGTDLFHKVLTLSQLKQGYRISTGSLANGLYLVKVYSGKQLYTYKLIKTGNLR